MYKKDKGDYSSDLEDSLIKIIGNLIISALVIYALWKLF